MAILSPASVLSCLLVKNPSAEPSFRKFFLVWGFGIPISSEVAYNLLDDFADTRFALKVTGNGLPVRDGPKSVYKIYIVDQSLSLAGALANTESKRHYGIDRECAIARYLPASCPEVDFVVEGAMPDAEYGLAQVMMKSGACRSTAPEASAKYLNEAGNHD